MNMMFCAILLLVNITVLPLFSRNAHAGELDLRPIESKPESLSHLHPDLKWMTEDKVRAIWIGDDLFDKFGDSDKTKGQVLVDTGFNLVRVSMGVNSYDSYSGVVDINKPYERNRDRSKSTDLETRLAPNIVEARRVGIPIMIGWQYGTHHLEPYRKYRSPTEGLGRYTCCPIEETYITGQHVGKWAVKIAEWGADGMVIDTEMYRSDKADYAGPCMCDDCFKTYLKEYAVDWQKTFNEVSADNRGTWVTEQKAGDHYAAFAATRTEAMYDSIRRRCQKINPTFFFGVAPMLWHVPGMERGLGTASVPCLVFSEHEYSVGPYRGSFIGTRHVRENLPALFLCGAYVAKQTPDEMADNIVQSSLYTDGWWPWYGTAFFNSVSIGESSWSCYGRVLGTTAGDYLDKITAAHINLDKLLALPKSQWPKRQDGKLKWLKKRIAEPEANPDKGEPQVNVDEAKADLEKYLKLVRVGGY
jgi:hypothetical protein